ncbi:galactokinase [Nesterenkonia muleiensis]|uniref:galactokinase n=1 Tax=Nesterenkonia muleiensis TaxID=2282648 RepID=UPI000E75FF54|nr:galactokinase [Nesterenkonia muleiensis]
MRTPDLSAAGDVEQKRAQSLSDDYVQRFGRQPQGIWVAPGRVNLIGEHTDYNDGLVMPFALPHSAMVAAASSTTDRVRVHSVNLGQTVEVPLRGLAPGSVTGWAAYPAAVVWSLGQAGYSVGGADLVLESTVPQGAGLSSSAALECAVAVALTELFGHAVDPLELAEIAQHAENAYVGMPCGVMDQMVSMLGKKNHVVQFDVRARRATLVPFRAQDAAILVVDTQAPHRLVDGEYAARRQQCKAAAHALGVSSLRELQDAGPRLPELLGSLDDVVLRRRARHVATENQRVVAVAEALARGNLRSVGEHMNASHASLREDYEVTVEETELAQQVLADGGAYGARITGAGFGGCVIGLVPEPEAERLAQELGRAFAEAGFRRPSAFTAVPAQGACRVR